MKKRQFIPVILLSVGLYACGVVPVTGRRTLSLVSDSEILSSSVSQYRSFIQKAPLSSNTTVNSRVNIVGKRIIEATMQYLKNNNHSELASQMAWEINVVNSNSVNAFCMPGGKIVVYTGLLNLIGAGSGADAQLAAVIGHEVAHALAKHANERISNQMLMQMGGNILGAAMGNQSAVMQTVIGQAYGLGTNVFVALPFGRKQELEADKIGLVLMAMAGYAPREAVNLWKKMGAGKSDQSEFLSTHPSDERRIKEIQAYLPNALQYYKPQTGFSYTATPQQNKQTQQTTKRKKINQ